MKQMPISKQNDRLNGDMTLRQYERGNAGVRLPGRNDIRTERQNTKYGKEANMHFGKNSKNEKVG